MYMYAGDVATDLKAGLDVLANNDFAGAGKFFLNAPHTDSAFGINAFVAFSKINDEEGMRAAARKLLNTPDLRAVQAWRWLAEDSKKTKDWATAYTAAVKAVTEAPEDMNSLIGTGDICKKAAKHKEAMLYVQRALALATTDDVRSSLRSTIAGLYKDIGEQQKALDGFAQAYTVGRNTNNASNRIMQAQYTHGVTLADYYNLGQEYSARFIRPLRKYQHALTRMTADKASNGLRIGFISGDFIGHSLTNLILEPMKALKALRTQHTFVLYFTREESAKDKWSAQYEMAVHEVRYLHGIGDKEAAQQIYDDQIDVLIDIAGHTAYNRLPVLGYKPAPVQAGWISGMMTPPAISTCNFFFTDKWLRPEGCEAICRETLIDLPAAYSYFPMEEAPDINPEPPRVRNGYLTFGSFNNPCKISPAVVALWAAVLRGHTGSRMHIKVYGRDHAQALKAEFAQNGVAEAQLEFVGTLPSTRDVMRYYNDKIDMVLDTFPCAGCLTSAEAMWAGTPVATLIGDTFLSRQTWTILNQVGLQDELGAATKDGFVQLVKEFCAGNRLGWFRNNIRRLMGEAPIRQPPVIAEGILAGCEDIWVKECGRIEALKGMTTQVAPV